VIRRPDSAKAVLRTLRDHHPHGVASTTLQDLHGPAAKTRIGEIRDMGYIVGTDMTHSGAVYTLVSLSPDRRASQARTVLKGVKVILRPDGEWVVEPYGTALDPEGSAALAAQIREALGLDSARVEQEDEDDEFAFGGTGCVRR